MRIEIDMPFGFHSEFRVPHSELEKLVKLNRPSARLLSEGKWVRLPPPALDLEFGTRNSECGMKTQEPPVSVFGFIPQSKFRIPNCINPV